MKVGALLLQLDITSIPVRAAKIAATCRDRVWVEPNGGRRLEEEADGMTLEMAYREVPQLDGLKIAFLVDPEGTRIELTEGLAGR